MPDAFDNRRAEAMRRRAAALGLASAAARAARPARAFDDHPSRVVVTVPPGTSPDVAARLLAEGLSRRRGRPLAVDNRAGGDGTVGAAAFARARPGEALGVAASHGGRIARTIYAAGNATGL